MFNSEKKEQSEKRTYDAPGNEYMLASGDDIILEMSTCRFAHA